MRHFRDKIVRTRILRKRAGAAHVQGMPTLPRSRGNVGKTPPLDQGLSLFLKAWDAWELCMNQSRDNARNGKISNGKGGNSGHSTSSDDKSTSDEKDSSGSWLVLGFHAISAIVLGSIPSRSSNLNVVLVQHLLRETLDRACITKWSYFQ